ncbi:hypothetical protein NEIMUCOT_04109 [Neisseria mucosa ATCC 25996]|uniref:Uncharacterized protein n=2 Tax=Neisseriaceae TaxID=481 RepID=D2ZU21_NEIM2|nr:hypothetical protein NEIMUCOT_04109 [Neisseria mucosa ATCC 25996]KIC06914.1 hypothetical protein MCC93_17050 [Morococcus cerebrosus]KJJ17287.1 hypothetical protein HMPREF3156_01281 [Neisseria sp. HMSC06F02]
MKRSSESLIWVFRRSFDLWQCLCNSKFTLNNQMIKFNLNIIFGG